MCRLAECLPHCYSGETRQMFTCHHSLLPENLLSIWSFIRYVYLNIIRKFLNPISSPRTVFGFVTFDSVFSPPKQTILFLVPFPYRAFTELQTSSPGLKPRTDFRGMAFVLQSHLWNKQIWSWRRSCLVSHLQKPPSHRDSNSGHFRILDFSEISFWFQDISMQSMV
jgi:hypothetical protein